MAGGGSLYSYTYPDGIVEQVPKPPATFDPVTASAATLAEYDFPSRPTGAVQLASWMTAMDAYKPGNTQPAMTVPVSAPPTSRNYTACNNESGGYGCFWGGYLAGTFNSTTDNYVGVKGTVTVPTISDSACTTSGGIQLYGDDWVGLGGTHASTPDDLVQEGIAWCQNNVSETVWSPFLEFASSENASLFCGQANWTSWTFPSGDSVYENLGWQANKGANGEANFYIQDVTTGTAYSCSRPPPSGSDWAFHGNTAEWVSETGQSPSDSSNGLAKYDSYYWEDANAQLNSNGNWVTVGSQSNQAITTGCSTSSYVQRPTVLGSDNESFEMLWHAYRYSCT
jgi:hypothetical protein